jgi:hypothetical protein
MRKTTNHPARAMRCRMVRHSAVADALARRPRRRSRPLRRVAGTRPRRAAALSPRPAPRPIAVVQDRNLAVAGPARRRGATAAGLVTASAAAIAVVVLLLGPSSGRDATAPRAGPGPVAVETSAPGATPTGSKLPPVRPGSPAIPPGTTPTSSDPAPGFLPARRWGQDAAQTTAPGSWPLVVASATGWLPAPSASQASTAQPSAAPVQSSTLASTAPPASQPRSASPSTAPAPSSTPASTAPPSSPLTSAVTSEPSTPSATTSAPTTGDATP